MSEFDSVPSEIADEALKRRLRIAANWPPSTPVSPGAQLYGPAPQPPGGGSPGNIGLLPHPDPTLASLATDAASSLFGPDAMDEPFTLASGATHASTFGELTPWFRMALNDYSLALTWRCLRQVLRDIGKRNGKVDPAPGWEGGVGLENFLTKLEARLSLEFVPVSLPPAIIRIRITDTASDAIRKAKLNNALLIAVLKTVVTPYIKGRNP